MNELNPAYVQIDKKEAARILGISITELDRRRREDPACPPGFKERKCRTAPVRFRLLDVYTYSQAVMDRAIEAKAN